MNSLVTINADDFGYTVDISKTIIDFINNGYCDTTTVMINSSSRMDSYQLANQVGLVDRVGLHLNITAGDPLTSDISKCASFCTNGKFGVYKAHRSKRFVLTSIEKKALEAEIRAQIEEYLKVGYKGMMLDSHQGIHMDWSIYPIVMGLCKEYGFVKVRRSPNISTDALRRSLHIPFDVALKRSGLQKTKYMGGIKDYLMSDVSYLEGGMEIMCHPQNKQGTLYIDETLGFTLEDYLAALSKREGKDKE